MKQPLAVLVVGAFLSVPAFASAPLPICQAPAVCPNYASGIGAIPATAGAVTTTYLADGSVDTAKIAVAAVDTTKIAADAVTTAKIISGAVDTAKIAVAAVTTVKIAAGAVDSSKLSSGVALPGGGSAAGPFTVSGVVRLHTATGTELFYCAGGTFDGNVCRGAACLCTGGTATALGVFVP